MLPLQLLRHILTEKNGWKWVADSASVEQCNPESVLDWVWRRTIRLKYSWILFTVREDGGYRFCNKIHIKVAESKVFSAFFQRGNFCHFYYFKKCKKWRSCNGRKVKRSRKFQAEHFALIELQMKGKYNAIWQMYITVKVCRKMPHLKRNFFHGQSKSFRVQENLWCRN